MKPPKKIGVVTCVLAGLILLIISVAFARNGFHFTQQNYVNYTGKQYSRNDDGTVRSERASSRVDIKINGSDQPLIVSKTTTFAIGWTIDDKIISDGYNCRVTGTDNGQFMEKAVSSSGEQQATLVIWPNLASNTNTIYSIDCRKGEVPNQRIEMKQVEVIYIKSDEPTK